MRDIEMDSDQRLIDLWVHEESMGPLYEILGLLIHLGILIEKGSEILRDSNDR